MKRDKLHIKNMVCEHCIVSVKEELEKLGLEVRHIKIGQVELREAQEYNLDEVKSKLSDEGFELMNDGSGVMITKIKSIISNQIHYNQSDSIIKKDLSEILETGIGRDYSYLQKRIGLYRHFQTNFWRQPKN